MGYILKMQEIASRVAMNEQQTVRFIADGFQDRSVQIHFIPNISSCTIPLFDKYPYNCLSKMAVSYSPTLDRVEKPYNQNSLKDA